MGCGLSQEKVFSSTSSHYEEEDDISTKKERREWESVQTEFQARTTYRECKDCSVPQLEFRKLLEYSIARLYLLEFIQNDSSLPYETKANFKGWMDIRAFKLMPECDAKWEMFHSINRNYFAGDQTLDLLLDMDVINDRFDAFQRNLFQAIYHQLFIPFKLSRYFRNMVYALRRKYNNVVSSDFEYRGVIGEGGFGLVVKVRKTSTGQMFAMKIQQKQKLYDMFGDEPWRADFEKQAVASCNHPFIVELFFAFQTKSVVALVMSLCTGDDLAKVLKKLGGPLGAEQVRFYAAEITSALSYLHKKGFIYRDLKPGNVLLCNDGNIKLIDFGSICDAKGDTLGMCNSVEALLPMFTRAKHQDNLTLGEYWRVSSSSPESGGHGSGSGNGTFSLSRNLSASNGEHIAGEMKDYGSPSSSQKEPMEEDSYSSQRANSLIGTSAYMAPEMISVMFQPTGYTKAVDWWSLGVSIYKLLVNAHPFAPVRSAPPNAPHAEQYRVGHARLESLLQPINFDPLLQEDTVVADFIDHLLTVHERDRLGYGPTGSLMVANHPYFQYIDWVKLEAKLLPPPPLPKIDSQKVNKNCRYGSLQDVLILNGKEHWMQSEQDSSLTPERLADLNDRVQTHFEFWDYTSPSAIMQELGHSNV